MPHRPSNTASWRPIRSLLGWLGIVKPSRDLPEPAGVQVGLVVLVIAGWLAFFAATTFGLWLFVSAKVPLNSTSEAVSALPAPRLQTDGRADLAGLLAAQQARLEGYGWVDRDKGLVSIPIEDAMKLVAGRGANAFAPLDAPNVDDARERAVNAAEGTRHAP